MSNHNPVPPHFDRKTIRFQPANKTGLVLEAADHIFCAIDAIYLARGAIYPANSNVWLKMRPMIFEMVPFTWQSSSWRSKVSESHGMPTIKSSHLLRIHYLFSTYFNHISEQCFGLENQDTTPEINSYGNPPVYTVEIGNWSIFQTG